MFSDENGQENDFTNLVNDVMGCSITEAAERILGEVLSSLRDLIEKLN